MDGGMGGLINRVKAMSGIYGLGFERESVAGMLLPFIVVIGLGAIGWVLIRNFL
jgi:hypothetical protein